MSVCFGGCIYFSILKSTEFTPNFCIRLYFFLCNVRIDDWLEFYFNADGKSVLVRCEAVIILISKVFPSSVLKVVECPMSAVCVLVIWFNTHLMLVEVNMGKAAHSQPLFQLPVSAVLVLPEGRFLHRCD